MRAKHWQNLLDACVVLVATAFVLSYFKLSLLLSHTTPTGGDNAGHFFTSWFFRYHVFSERRLSDWCAGHYAGYPLLQYYFPLPFLLMSIISLAVPLEVAFKVVTVLGPASLPVCAYFFIRWLGVGFPGPAAGSVLSLIFLFNEGNSVWGGNIPSLLAGEFSYCLAFSFSLLFMGSLYRGIQEQNRYRWNAILLALVGINHACGLIYSGLIGFFFLLDRIHFRRNLIYLLKVWTWAFLLLGIWIVPLLAGLHYTTPFNFVWVVSSWREALPVIVRPVMALGLLYLIFRIIRGEMPKNERFLAFGIALAGILYLVGYELHVPDIRFVPYAQILLILLPALLVGIASKYIRASWILSLLILLSGLWWVRRHVAYIPSWIQWNYSGVESKPAWSQYKEIAQTVSGTVQDPRVAYENSPGHNRFGTMRMFELLPYFSGRSTLEGLYIQDSISSPFVYLIQGEISKDASHPVPGYYYPYQNLRAGIQHLQLFNTGLLILVSDMMKKEAARIPELRLKKSIPPIEIYELRDNDGQYVTPLKNQPVLYTGPSWKQASYNWFRHVDQLDIPLLFEADGGASELASLARTTSFSELPRRPYPEKVAVKTEMKPSEILIHTSKVGHPLLIKVSYHPKWKVEGADRIYLASPSFMLVFPTQQDVRLRFSHNWADITGWVASLVALLALFFGAKMARWDPPMARAWIPSRHFWTGITVLALVGAGWIGWNAWNRPQKLEARAMKAYDRKEFEKAAQQFEYLYRRYPQTGVAYRSLFFSAMCRGQLGQTEAVKYFWDQLVRDFPDGFYTAEGYFRKWNEFSTAGKQAQAEVMARELLERFPDNYWAKLLRTERAKRQ